MSNDVNPILMYTRMGISVIPLTRTFDEDKQKWTGKRPHKTAKGWERFSHTNPTESDAQNWVREHGVWGLAVVCGPASNICCVDIDTEDEELQQRILAQLPHTPVVVKGKPGRYGKLIYRIAEHKESIPEDYSFTKSKVLGPDRKRPVVEFFFSHSYICIPPSFHSGSTDQDVVYYKWQGMELDLAALRNLPVLDPVVIERVRLAVDGATHKQIQAVLPGTVETEEVSGRWQTLTGIAGSLIHQRVGFEAAVDHLLKYDIENYPNNQYFLDKSKGSGSISPRINAYKFYSDLLHSFALKKKFERDIEVPELPKFAELYEMEGWEDPIPLPKRVHRGQFNPNWMPEPIRQIVMQSSEATAVDPALVFFYMLGTFSSCLGNKVIIQPYHLNREYTERSNLYIGVVSKSGDRKSEVTKIAKKPLMRIQKEMQERMRDIKKKGDVINENISIRAEKIKSDIRKEIEDNGVNSPFAAKLHQELAELEATKVVTRSVSLYEQGGNTTEAYYGILESNPSGIFIEFNEWGLTYDALEAREGGRLRNFLLDGWDGQNTFTYKTKHQGENIIKELNLSVGFSVQEDVISHIFWKFLTVKKSNDGLMQRFMLILSDGKHRPPRDVSFTIPEELNTIFRNAYEIERQDERVMLSTEAYDLWMAWLAENQRYRMESSIPAFESFYSKHDGLIVRIACNLAHMRNKGRRIQQIEAEDIRTAREICLYLRTNFEGIRDLAENSILHEIGRMIEMGTIQDGTQMKELHRNHPTMFGDMTTARERMAILHDHNYVRICRDKKGYYVKVNPKLRKT